MLEVVRRMVKELRVWEPGGRAERSVRLSMKGNRVMRKLRDGERQVIEQALASRSSGFQATFRIIILWDCFDGAFKAAGNEWSIILGGELGWNGETGGLLLGHSAGSLEKTV